MILRISLDGSICFPSHQRSFTTIVRSPDEWGRKERGSGLPVGKDGSSDLEDVALVRFLSTLDSTLGESLTAALLYPGSRHLGCNLRKLERLKKEREGGGILREISWVD